MMNNDLNRTSTTLQSTMQKLLFINIVLAALTLLANGSALYFGLSGKNPEVLANLHEITIIVIGATIVLATAIFATFKSQNCIKVLAFHSVLLAIATVGSMLWGLKLACQSTDNIVNWAEETQIGISWSVGWLTAMASYSAYLVSITFLAHVRNCSIVVKYAYVWIGIIVFL